MKKIILILIITSSSQRAFTQQQTDKEAINKVVETFMNCLIKKDSATFYGLFHTDPVVWVGGFKDKTNQAILKKDNTFKGFFSSTYKEFYRFISDKGLNEEKFYNIKIDNDESIATVMFDYSFWENKKKINWGKEHWGLIKTAGQWKITSVIFSMDYETINPEPQK
jgi:hypothetical protein